MIQKPKGTYDVYGTTGKKILYLENVLKEMMSLYNYEYYRTPIIEASELFHRGVGNTTDIVTKETYDFKDRGDRNITLRPEGTAGIVRSFIENKQYGNPKGTIKTWYYGPMYRYERPQSGRYREFYQFGVEVFGSNDPLVDAEVISIPVNFYKVLGLKGIKVNINSLGDDESRNNYREALLKYFKPYLNDLCEDCKNRYQINPLRILDCKVDHNLEIMNNAPKITDYLNEKSKKHFAKVCEYLESMGIEYEINPNIVRGLDYYNHTVFEVEADIEGFGSQNVLCGGGRYNNLVETIGGPSTPGMGFALGFERLLSALNMEEINLPVEDELDIYVIPVSENEKSYALGIINILRLNGFSVDTDYQDRKIGANFKQSERLNAKLIIIIGEEEVKNNQLTIKNNKTKEETKIETMFIINYLDELLNEHECHCHDCKKEDENNEEI